jgi:hypothetical protein
VHQTFKSSPPQDDADGVLRGGVVLLPAADETMTTPHKQGFFVAIRPATFLEKIRTLLEVVSRAPLVGRA